MTPWHSGHFSIFGVVFFAFKSLLRIARQLAILTLWPRSHVRILIYRTWAIAATFFFTDCKELKLAKTV